MGARKCLPNRVHLIAHANPVAKDVRRFRFADTPAYLQFIRDHLPSSLRLTCSQKLLDAAEDEQHGGRCDDAVRIHDLQDALDDPHTLAVVAAAGGAYFSRLLPQIDFAALAKRKTPLWALGFSEMTTLVNLVASHRGGRGLYWLCPNYLAWQIRPPARARAAFAEFWGTLPLVLGGRTPSRTEHLTFSEVRGRLVRGEAHSGPVRLVGGCLSVLVVMLAGPLAKRLKPAGRWLVIEDVNEAPYRIDRHLAALKIAGWFERVAGVLVGSFHTKDQDQTPAVLELLKHHVPADRRFPIVTTRSIGHVWPMAPLPINRRLRMSVSRRTVAISV